MLHKNIRLIALFNFFLDFRLFAPVAILYFQSVTGSFALGMSVFSVVFLSSALLEIPTGIFSDKIGRKKTLVIGSLATISSLVLYAIGSSVFILYIGAFFEGLGRSLYSGNNEALLHASLKETHQEQEYHMYLGKTSSMFQIASAVAAIAGGILAYWSFGLVMWVSVIPAIICFWLALQIKEPKLQLQDTGNVYHHLVQAFQNIRRNARLRWLSAFGIVGYGVGEAAYEFQAAFYALVWPTWALGIARTISNVFAATSFFISGRVINRFSALRLLLAEGVLSPIIKIFAVLFVTPLSPIIISATSFLYGFGSVAGNSLRQREFTDEQRATMGSIVSFGGSITLAAAAFTLGALADRTSVVTALVTAHIILLASNLLLVKVYQLDGSKTG